MLEIQGKYTKALIHTDKVEPQCISQIHTMINHPAFTEPVSIMPDCHAGKGSVIGFTMPLTEMVIPQTIGVDIGCGMLAVKIEKPKTLNLEEIDKTIRNRIPFGPNVRQNDETHRLKEGDKFFTEVQSDMNQMWLRLNEKFNIKAPKPPQVSYQWFMDKCKEIGQDFTRAQMGIGTLGGGK